MYTKRLNKLLASQKWNIYIYISKYPRIPRTAVRSVPVGISGLGVILGAMVSDGVYGRGYTYRSTTDAHYYMYLCKAYALVFLNT